MIILWPLKTIFARRKSFVVIVSSDNVDEWLHFKVIVYLISQQQNGQPFIVYNTLFKKKTLSSDLITSVNKKCTMKAKTMLRKSRKPTIG